MSDRIEPCPNRECGHRKYLVVRSGDSETAVECRKCGMVGPRASWLHGLPLGEAVGLADSEARRRWNNLPRGASATDFL